MLQESPPNFPFVCVCVALPAYHVDYGNKRPEVKEAGGPARHFQMCMLRVMINEGEGEAEAESVQQLDEQDGVSTPTG